MPKRREQKARIASPTVEQIEEFGEEADGGIVDTTKKTNLLDPNAKRDFKSISLTFNEYEFIKLQEGSTATRRTKLNFIRYAILKLAEEIGM